MRLELQVCRSFRCQTYDKQIMLGFECVLYICSVQQPIRLHCTAKGVRPSAPGAHRGMRGASNKHRMLQVQQTQ